MGQRDARRTGEQVQIDIRKMLRAADAELKAGNHPRAIQLYDRIAEHYAEEGRHVHAVAISKQLLRLIDEQMPVLAPLYRHVWMRLATAYEAMRMEAEATEARAKWEALAEEESRVRPGSKRWN